MKRIYTLVALAGIFSAAYGQVPDTSAVEPEPEKEKSQKEKRTIVKVDEDADRTVVRVGPDDFVVVEEENDTVKVKIGKKAIKIVEDKEGSVEIINEEDFEKHGWKKRAKKFKGHWSGLELGLNNYSATQFRLDLPPTDNYMDLNTGRSWNFNLNFMQYSLGLGRNLGFVTGLGAEFNSYFFDNENNIEKIEGYIEPLDLSGLALEKSKFKSTYLNVPVMFEVHPTKNRKFFVSAGVIGGLKIASSTKVVYREAGNKERDKSKGDMNLQPLRYYLTARVGYKALKLYANYSPMGLFQKGAGPELYPFSVGLTLISF